MRGDPIATEDHALAKLEEMAKKWDYEYKIVSPDLLGYVYEDMIKFDGSIFREVMMPINSGNNMGNL